MRSPDITGPSGSAWKGSSPTPEMLAKWPASLDRWLLHCPGVHAFWSRWVVSVVSLRDYPEYPPARRESPDMTHEVLIFALDPDYSPGDDWCLGGDGRWTRHMLQPADLIEQISSITDEMANELVFLFARACCHRQALPDSDYQSRNRTLLHGTADHLRQGRHTPS